ncbi:MAG: hypothetical protein DBX38_04455 [Eubacteriales Family XIII. Incertae Sedis bacterium]|nr:MAG: hypothetical protein DBX38_04455 [Clostridiales Family XIII bacterium]
MENNFNIPAEVGKLKVRGNIEIVAGIVLAAAGLISMAKLTVDFFIYINWYMYFGFADFIGKVLLFFGLMIIGVILIMFGVKNNNFVKKYYEYVKFLAVDSNMYISVLAVSVHETVQTTQKNIMRMIELGFFPNIQLDAAAGRLIYGDVMSASSISSGMPLSEDTQNDA